ncbi:MAG: hypothetical protein IPN36_10035 [Bacteroidetes bacterium]|nr:hypothetical protein [Bacteroidota bacterium]
MKHLQTIILLFFSIISLGQTTEPKTNIIGKWTMVKHILVETGKPVEKLNNDAKIDYEFKIDGAYELTSAFKYQGKWDTVVTVGKWKISTDKRKIELFNNKFLSPHDKDGTCADHPLLIKKLSATEFVTEEYWFSEGPAGTSSYKKQ